MGVEAKRMAKSLAATAGDDSFASRMKSWPDRVKTFYNDVRSEMRIPAETVGTAAFTPRSARLPIVKVWVL